MSADRRFSPPRARCSEENISDIESQESSSIPVERLVVEDNPLRDSRNSRTQSSKYGNDESEPDGGSIHSVAPLKISRSANDMVEHPETERDPNGKCTILSKVDRFLWDAAPQEKRPDDPKPPAVECVG